MSSFSHSRPGVSVAWPLRLLVVGAAVLVTVIVWLLADKAAGIDLHQPAFSASTPKSLSLGFVAVVAGIAALLAWALLALIERFSKHGTRAWLIVALLALLVSLGGPLSGHGVGNADRIALAFMHLAAAAAIIPLLYRSSLTRADRHGPATGPQ